jgi:hypothetical protein
MTTSNYNGLTELYTPNITVTTAHKVFSVFTIYFLVMASNNSYSSSSMLKSSLNGSSLPTLPTELCQSQSYFMTGGLPPITSSWRQAPWGSRPEISFQLNPYGHSSYITYSLMRGQVCLLWICLAFVKCMYRTFSESKSNQSYSMTGGLPPISSSSRQALWDPRPEIFFNWTLAVTELSRVLCYNRRSVSLSLLE